jgi:hypothetical protein
MECSRLPTFFQEFIHVSRYARWNEEKGRRETWPETIARYVDYMCDKQCKGKVTPEVKEEIRKSIMCLEVMPSMRCLMTAGAALERDNIAGFNCCYIAVDNPVAFDEMLYILMCFHPDTEIRIRGGTKKISEITPDDEVASFDEETGNVVYTKPSRVLCNPTENSPKMKLTFDDGTEYICTEDHLFYTKNRKWVKACELSEDDDFEVPV